MNVYDVQCPVFQEEGGICVTSPFGWRVHPVSGRGEGHKGVDIVRWTGYGNTATITAFAPGTVQSVRDSVRGTDTVNAANSAGNYVIVDHGGGWVSKYFHLQYGSVVVKPGEQVRAGQAVGYMGNTGNSTGAHLHFQLEHDGEPIDALPYLLGEEKISGEEDRTLDISEKTDSEPQEWAREDVEWAVQTGILRGDEQGNLMLREPCTREQMCIFLHRLAMYMEDAR